MSVGLKSKVGHILTKTEDSRINLLIIGGVTIDSDPCGLCERSQ
jgi:hypothetical protein